LKVLLDEMYPDALAKELAQVGIDAVTVADLGLSGQPDISVFSASLVEGRAVLTENVSDFVRIAAEHSASGGRHAGVIIALSNRFSRRPAGWQALVAAIHAMQNDPTEDRIVYLSDSGRP
jgi:predicted nuclease of predicted toxin-antitoxin system